MRRWWILAMLLLLGLSALGWMLATREPAEAGPTRSAGEALDRERPANAGTSSANQALPSAPSRRAGDRTAPLAERRAQSVRDYRPWAHYHEQVDKLRNRAEEWARDDYRIAVREPEQPIDAETAFVAYQHASSCVGEIGGEETLELRRRQYGALFEHYGDQLGPERRDRMLRRLEASFERCGSVGPDPLRAALQWLELSAELGFLPAQLAYVDEVPQLLRADSFRVFREPGLLQHYRERSDDYLRLALGSRHPQAFEVMARSIESGRVYEPDPVLASAYRLTADRLRHSARPGERASAVNGLDAEQLREARRLARELCARYCPDAAG